MKALGLILARGGSQRVAQKNIRPLGGVPLLAHTITEIKNSRYVQRLVVSTNDDEIAATAVRYGAEAPFRRPESISGPDSTEWEAFSHAMEWFRSSRGALPEYVVLLRPTTPFRKVQTVDRAIELLMNTPEADSVRSVRWCSEHPHKMWVAQNGRISSLIPMDQKKPQAHTLSYHLLPPVYIQNASFDVIRVAHAMEKASTTGTHILPIEMDERESIDINTELDFEFAEFLLQKTLMGQPLAPR